MAKCYYSYHFTTRHTSVYITFNFINGYNKTQTDQNICYQKKTFGKWQTYIQRSPDSNEKFETSISSQNISEWNILEIIYIYIYI